MLTPRYILYRFVEQIVGPLKDAVEEAKALSRLSAPCSTVVLTILEPRNGLEYHETLIRRVDVAHGHGAIQAAGRREIIDWIIRFGDADEPVNFHTIDACGVLVDGLRFWVRLTADSTLPQEQRDDPPPNAGDALVLNEIVLGVLYERFTQKTQPATT